MKKTRFLLMILIVSFSNAYSQTENYLKLSKIVVIDSLRNSVSVSPTNRTVLFSITVPNNVYWKINFFELNTNNSSTYAYLKINNSYIVENTQQTIEKTTPIWIKPNSIIKFESTGLGVSNTSVNPSIYLSGEEYSIGP